MSIEASGVISEADYLAAQRLHARPGGAVRWLRWVALALVALSLPLALWQAAQGDAAGLIVLIPFAVAALTMLLSHTLLVPGLARRHYRQYKVLQQPLVITLDEQGSEWRAANGSSRLAWPDYHQWKEDETLFLLYQADNLFQMLPKRLLGPEEAAQVRRWLGAVPSADQGGLLLTLVWLLIALTALLLLVTRLYALVA